MSMLSRSLLPTALAVATTWNIPVHALSLHACSVEYCAAQTTKTLNGMSSNEFQKVQCGLGAAAAATSTPTKAAATAPIAAPTLNIAAPSKSMRTYHAAPTGGPSNTNLVFPTAVSPKYGRYSAGRARMLTCLDQYMANKADNMNGGLKWIQQGGGYYSACNRHLKGAGA